MNFDLDREKLGTPASARPELNAATQWFDHQRAVRGPNDRTRLDQRVMGNWWGDAAIAKAKATQIGGHY